MKLDKLKNLWGEFLDNGGKYSTQENPILTTSDKAFEFMVEMIEIAQKHVITDFEYERHILGRDFEEAKKAVIRHNINGKL